MSGNQAVSRAVFSAGLGRSSCFFPASGGYQHPLACEYIPPICLHCYVVIFLYVYGFRSIHVEFRACLNPG